MDSRVWTASETFSCISIHRKSFFSTKLIPKPNPFCLLSPKTHLKRKENIIIFTEKQGRRRIFAIVMEKKTEDSVQVFEDTAPKTSEDFVIVRLSEQRLARKRKERNTYLVAAVMSSLGVSFAAIMAVYYRFSWQMEGGEFPLDEMFGTFFLAVGSAAGMEFWARWAHSSLWHASLWHMHESHHRPRDGPFELNDVFAIINAVPAIALMSYGFFNPGLVAGLCFGAGLGITMYGMAYMFVHDGLVHRRFPVGAIANVPYLRKVAAAHQLHHSDKFQGVPYGLFLGPKEVEVVGGMDELEKEIRRRIKPSKSKEELSS